MKIWDSVYLCHQFRSLRNLRIDIKVINYGDLHPIPEVVRYPHFEDPYPTTNGDNKI